MGDNIVVRTSEERRVIYSLMLLFCVSYDSLPLHSRILNVSPLLSFSPFEK